VNDHDEDHDDNHQQEGSAAMSVLDMREVRKVYRNGGDEIVALDHATLQVEHGEIVALLGPSGSGKTTLLSIAGGLLAATEGSVVVNGTDIAGHDSRALTRFRRDNVGFVFQSVNLVPFLDAEQNLLVVDELGGGKGGKAAKARARQLLDELGLGQRRRNLPAQLSGGERQRVAIGRALFNNPRLVLFDEPTSALDTKIGEQVMELIRTEMKARDTAAVIVTHDRRMTHFADRTVEIVDGRLGADLAAIG